MIGKVPFMLPMGSLETLLFASFNENMVLCFEIFEQFYIIMKKTCQNSDEMFNHQRKHKKILNIKLI